MEQLSTVSLETEASGLPAQKQAVLPKEFQKNLTAATLQKEKPGKNIHNSPDSKKVEEQRDEADETSSEADAALFFSGLLTAIQEQPMKQEAALLTAVESSVTEPPLLTAVTSVLAEQAMTEVDLQQVTTWQEGKASETVEQVLIKKEALSTENLLPTKVQSSAGSEQKAAGAFVSVSDEEQENKKWIKEEKSLSTMEVQVTAVQSEKQLTESVLPTGRFMTENWKAEKDTAASKAELEHQVPVKEDSQIKNSQTFLSEADLETGQISKASSTSAESVVKKENLQAVSSHQTELAAEEPTVNNLKDHKVQEQPLFNGLMTGTQTEVSETTGVGRQQVAQAVKEVIAETMETFKTGKQSSAEVNISPGRMGNIQIKLELIDNVLSTKMVVDSLKTHELLTGSLQQLTDNLNRQQIQLGEVTIQLNTNGETGFSFAEGQTQEQRKQMPRQTGTIATATASLTKSEEATVKQPGRLSILV